MSGAHPTAPEPPPHLRVHLRVHGRVQGVAFRAHTQAKAQALGLTGWVRNEPEGSVEAVAEGPVEALEAWLAWCHGGPRAARVEGVEVIARTPATGEFVEFSIRG